MAPYIHSVRSDTHIIDLSKAVVKLNEAYNALKELAASGKPVLFVGTKKQAKDTIKEEALACGAFYINERWLGGTLTNFATIRKRIDRLKSIEKMVETGEISVLPKKEQIKLLAEAEKLEKNLGGIKNMVHGSADSKDFKKDLPCALFVVDIIKEKIAIKEARLMGIPVIGIVDTNGNPDDVDYVIPGNDDAIRAIKLIAGRMAQAVLEAKGGVDSAATESTVIADAIAAEEKADDTDATAE
jgi:small subunit ribosomal protein S2